MKLLMADNLYFSYNRATPVLAGASFSIDSRDTVALIGANGSGKTTLSKILMGMLRPEAGRVLIGGRDIGSMELAEIGARIGYVFQQPSRQLFTASVYEEIAFGLRFRGLSSAEVDRRVTDGLDHFGLTHLADRFPFNLSRGERQRLAIAAIMALEPEFAVFDEPTTGLDIRSKSRFLSLLERVRERGVGYMIISHDRDLCGQCTMRTLELSGGRVCG